MNTYKGFSLDLSLEDKIAVVTGAASGIGNAIAQMMSAKGAKVVMLDLNAAVMEAAVKVDNAVGFQLDICDYIKTQATVKKIVGEVGPIDILCNIAGLGSGVNAESVTKEEFDRVLMVNLNAAFYMAQLVGREMIAANRGGRIINMASQAGIVALHGHVAYSASKAGLLAVTRDLALEWGKYGITTNAISPTVVMTPMAKEYWSGKRGADHIAQIPAGRFAEMDEIAIAACYLASDAAAMVNGANLVIDGGFTIC